MKVLLVLSAQKEVAAPERPFAVRGLDTATDALMTLLDRARASRDWRVVHMPTLVDGAPIFNPNSAFSDFLPGLGPLEGETVWPKSDICAFDVPSLTELAQKLGATNLDDGPCFAMAGFVLQLDILATAIAAARLGVSAGVIGDACASLPAASVPADGSENAPAFDIGHSVLLEAIRYHLPVLATADVIEGMQAGRRPRLQRAGVL